MEYPRNGSILNIMIVFLISLCLISYFCYVIMKKSRKTLADNVQNTMDKNHTIVVSPIHNSRTETPELSI